MKKLIVLGVMALGGCVSGPVEDLGRADYECVARAVDALPAPRTIAEVEPTARTALGRCNGTRDDYVENINSIQNRMTWTVDERRDFIADYDARRYREAMELAGARLSR